MQAVIAKQGVQFTGYQRITLGLKGVLVPMDYSTRVQFLGALTVNCYIYSIVRGSH